MAKDKMIFICSECSYKTSKWIGKCPDCNSWGSFEEFNELEIDKKLEVSKVRTYSLSEIQLKDDYKMKSSLKEFDRVIGGGLVKGAVSLLTGHPGVGKSTLLLQVLDEYTKFGDVLYVSGEESPEQIGARAVRLGVKSKNLFIMSETCIESIENYIREKKPVLVAIDSIQTLYSKEQNSISGTVSQIRDCTLKIVEIAKKNRIAFFLIGHITKDGKVAGPKLLEHMVDSVYEFEGDGENAYRILRSVKNRFGASNEIGIFNMEEDGLREVINPSEYFLNKRDEENIGSIIVPVLEGQKIFLLELQALTIESNFGTPRRVVQGMDYNRVQIISAILEKRLKIIFMNRDIFINVPGGISIKETGGDLGIAMILISEAKNININKRVAAIGEIGLRGEIRKVSFPKKRLKELEKIGFKKAFLPESNKKEIEKEEFKIERIYIKNIQELLERMNSHDGKDRKI